MTYVPSNPPGPSLPVYSYKPDPPIRPSYFRIDLGRYPTCLYEHVRFPYGEFEDVPNIYTGICEPVQRKAIAIKDMILFMDIYVPLSCGPPHALDCPRTGGS